MDSAPPPPPPFLSTVLIEFWVHSPNPTNEIYKWVLVQIPIFNLLTRGITQNFNIYY